MSSNVQKIKQKRIKTNVVCSGNCYGKWHSKELERFRQLCEEKSGDNYMLNNEEIRNLAEECMEILGKNDYMDGIACLGLLALKWRAVANPLSENLSRWREMVEKVGYDHGKDVEVAVWEVFSKNHINDLYQCSSVIYNAKFELQKENENEKQEKTKMSKISMREALYEIDNAFDKFSDLLYNTDALLEMLDKIENLQSGGPSEEVCMIAAGVKYYVQNLRSEMGKIYTDVDMALLRADRENIGRAELVPITPVDDEEETVED